ncbi:ATP-dependent DNA helicase PIF1-like [Argopecten irradians]|uniref:ATP-dependent DNA helicase PIF1-like n=1 Tax=Argopecten irradians TaxID=31199 RepID=UPI003714F577
MRQKGDFNFAQMLSRLHTADHSPDDIEVLKSKIISRASEHYPKTALHIFPTRADVESHNSSLLNAQPEEKVDIVAITKYPRVLKNYDCSQVVGGLCHHLRLCKNARIMLVKNLDVADGLVNGATGIILDILHNEQSSPMPKALIVKFDNRNIGRLARQSSKISLQSYKDGVPILPVEVKQNAGRSDTSPEITRIQFPVVLCWACTIHKVQGQTLDNVVISFKRLRTKGQAYVAFSRITSLRGLFLLDFNADAIKKDNSVSEEMTRLRNEKSIHLFFR